MRNQYLQRIFCGVLLALPVSLTAQNVGVGTAAPAAKLEVDGGFAVTPVTLPAGAAITVPVNETVIRITNDAANVAIAVAAPATATEGQFLSIRNEDATNTATFAGTAIPAGQMAEFMFLNGAWRFRAGTAGTDWALAGNAGTGAEVLGTTNGQPLRVITNNTERARVDANGNVGIGTTTPHAALQLGNVTANRRIVMWEEANDDHQFYGLGLNSFVMRYQVSNTGASHAFYTGTGAATSTELMRITGMGNVGIGTAAPSARLHVNAGDIRIDLGRSLNLLPTDNFAYDGDVIGHYSAGWYDDSWSPGSPSMWLSGYGGIKFFAAGSAWMAMSGGGNLGISNLNPTARLHINGAYANTHTAVAAAAAPAIGNNIGHVRLTAVGGAQANAIAGPGAPVEGQILTIVNEDDNNATFSGTTIYANGGVGSFIRANGAWRTISSANGNGWGLLGNSGTVAGTNFIGTTDAVRFDMRTSNAIRASIDANGNVGIGTTTPNAALQLGNVITNRRIVMYETVNNDHEYLGFGINNNTLRYQVANASDNHIFFRGNGAAASVELMRIMGNGNVGISNTAPGARLDITANYGALGNGTYFGTRSAVSAATTNVVDVVGVQGSASGTDDGAFGVWGNATGTGTNYGGYFTASGGGNNFGLVVATGFTGIANTTPQTTLHMNGGFANAVATVAPAAAPAIPNHTSHVRIGVLAGAQANAIVGPGIAVDGQILTIVNEDDNNATFSGTTIYANGGVGSFIRANGAWRTISSANGNGWGLLGNSGTVAGTNFVGTTDAVRFDVRTNNAIRTTVDANGLMGIGIVNPGARLTIRNNGTDPGVTDDGKVLFVSGAFNSGQAYDGGVEFRHDNVTQGIGFGFNTIYASGSNADQELNIISRGTGHIRMQAHGGVTGNVGIGVLAPSAKLEVYGGTNGLNARLGAGTGWNNASYPTLSGTSAEQWIMIHNPHLPYLQNGVNGYAGATTGSQVRMAANPAAGAYWDAGILATLGTDAYGISRQGGAAFVTVNNVGNLGVGTTTPDARVHVNGGLVWLNEVGANGNFVIPNTCAGNWVVNVTSGIYAPEPGGGCGDDWWLALQNRGGESRTLQLGVGNDPDDHLALMASGNIGVGTITPGFKFEVAGTQRILRASGSWNWTQSHLIIEDENNAGFEPRIAIHNPGVAAPMITTPGNAFAFISDNFGGWVPLYASNYFIGSDSTLKKEIQHLNNEDLQQCLAQVRNMASVRYRYNYEVTGDPEPYSGNVRRDQPHLGILAQTAPSEVVSPMAGPNRQDEFLGVSLGDLSGLLVASTKALDSQVQTLQQVVQQQQQEIEALKQLVNEMRQQQGR